jgi:ABC-type transport system involved in multi-copper enzyme maturation permease subunit
MDSGELIFHIFIQPMYVVVVWCWVVGMSAAASVCRERERGTLDGLLTLPVSRSAVAGAKWLGAILNKRFYFWAIIVLAYFVGIGAAHSLRALFLPVTLAAQIAFLSSLGLRVSVASRTTLRARVVMTLLLLVFFAAGWAAWSMDSEAATAVDPFGTASDGWTAVPAAAPGQVRGLFYAIGLNPIGSWAFLCGIRNPGVDPAFERQFLRTEYAVAACGALVYASAAGLLWLDARRRLRAESNG